MRRRTVSAVLALLAGLAARDAHAQTVAITNAKIYTIAGPVIERGTVVIQDGKIAAVGANVAVPAAAQVVDGSGKIVTPGFFDASTGLGAVEIGAVRGTNDLSVNEPHLSAAFTVADEINPFSTVIPVQRVEGITRAAVAPTVGGRNAHSIIAGQGAVIDLGTDPTSMVDRAPAAMHVVLGSQGAEIAGGARGAAILELREALQDAKDYAANRRAFEANQRRPYALSRLDLEALIPVVEGRLPLVVKVDRASDILTVLRVAREYNVKLVLSGVQEGWRVAPEIARAHVPVILNPIDNLPDFEWVGATLENAGRLANAGVDVAFATFDSHNARDLKQFAGNAVSYGMPYDAALRAVTVNPARIFGIADRYGTLEPGKDADVVLWSGDPFELTTRVERVYIKGREMPKETRQTELLERYRTLDDGPVQYRR
ncbi:MAG: amidohydrolase family protein [Gemmatimonadetes bacterium]|nr:amidohydrolase family protein [Gemmatimonadota bacterium]